MARTFYRKARKAYPDNGIEKGQQYYYCKIKTGPRSSRVLRQLKPFKRSQLTSSEFLGRQYDLEEQLEEMETGEGLADQAQEIADEIRALGEEQEEKLQNMPDQLQYSPTGELLQERYDGCNEWADNIEGELGDAPEEKEAPEDEPDEPKEADFDETDDYEQAKDEYDTAFAAWEEAKEEYDTYLGELDDFADNLKQHCYEGG